MTRQDKMVYKIE